MITKIQETNVNIKVIADDKYFKNQDLSKLESFVKKHSKNKVNIKKIISLLQKKTKNKNI